jgi:hypothetical protein
MRKQISRARGRTQGWGGDRTNMVAKETPRKIFDSKKAGKIGR